MSCENEPIRLSPEQEEEAVSRCFRVVDIVSDLAINIITNFIQNIPCSEAKRVLLASPETLAIGAFNQALNNVVSAGQNPKRRMH